MQKLKIDVFVESFQTYENYICFHAKSVKAYNASVWLRLPIYSPEDLIKLLKNVFELDFHYVITRHYLLW